MGAEANLKDLGIQLPPPFKATGMFQPLVVSGGLGYIAGHGCRSRKFDPAGFAL
jgi:hypothetical protein